MGLVIAEHGTRTKNIFFFKKRETETEAKPSCGLCHKLVIAEHGTKTKNKKKKPKPKPSLLAVFATSWSLLNMATKKTETEAKPSCGLCHKLVIAEHGTKTHEKKGNRNRSQAFLW